MSVCDEKTPFLTGEDYVSHISVCPNKYPNECIKTLNTLIRYADTPFFQKQIVKAIKKSSEQFNYMITFTVDTKKKEMKSPQDIKEVEDYIIKIINSKTLKHIISSEIVYEVGSGGNHHWHVYAKCTRCLKRDRFGTYIKKYGIVDVSRSRTNDTDEIIGYMSKDNQPTKIK